MGSCIFYRLHRFDNYCSTNKYTLENQRTPDGISGLTGLAFGLASIQMTFPIVLFCTLIMLTGILGSARIGLGRHTLMQVTAGVINGFIWVFGSILLISFYFNIT